MSILGKKMTGFSVCRSTRLVGSPMLDQEVALIGVHQAIADVRKAALNLEPYPFLKLGDKCATAWGDELLTTFNVGIASDLDRAAAEGQRVRKPREIRAALDRKFQTWKENVMKNLDPGPLVDSLEKWRQTCVARFGPFGAERSVELLDQGLLTVQHRGENVLDTIEESAKRSAADVALAVDRADWELQQTEERGTNSISSGLVTRTTWLLMQVLSISLAVGTVVAFLLPDANPTLQVSVVLLPTLTAAAWLARRNGPRGKDLREAFNHVLIKRAAAQTVQMRDAFVTYFEHIAIKSIANLEMQLAPAVTQHFQARGADLASATDLEAELAKRVDAMARGFVDIGPGRIQLHGEGLARAVFQKIDLQDLGTRMLDNYHRKFGKPLIQALAEDSPTALDRLCSCVRDLVGRNDLQDLIKALPLGWFEALLRLLAADAHGFGFEPLHNNGEGRYQIGIPEELNDPEIRRIVEQLFPGADIGDSFLEGLEVTWRARGLKTPQSRLFASGQKLLSALDDAEVALFWQFAPKSGPTPVGQTVGKALGPASIEVSHGATWLHVGSESGNGSKLRK